MGFDEYQEKAKKYDFFEATEDLKAIDALKQPGFMEKVLGLTGEAGEIADKIKKILRDKGGVISDDDRAAVVKELGDTLWYVASIARYLGVPLSEVASVNLDKLEGRVRRGTMHGEGDER